MKLSSTSQTISYGLLFAACCGMKSTSSFTSLTIGIDAIQKRFETQNFH